MASLSQGVPSESLETILICLGTLPPVCLRESPVDKATSEERKVEAVMVSSRDLNLHD